MLWLLWTQFLIIGVPLFQAESSERSQKKINVSFSLSQGCGMLLYKFGFVLEYLGFSIYDNGNLPGYSSLGWFLCSFRVYMTFSEDHLAFRVSDEKLYVVLIVLPLYVTWLFTLIAFSILSMFCAFGVLIIRWQKKFTFLSYLFGVV